MKNDHKSTSNPDNAETPAHTFEAARLLDGAVFLEASDGTALLTVEGLAAKLGIQPASVKCALRNTGDASLYRVIRCKDVANELLSLANVPAKARSIVLMTEEGARVVAMRANGYLSTQVCKWLACVWGKLDRGETVHPHPDAADKPTLSEEKRMLLEIKLIRAQGYRDNATARLMREKRMGNRLGWGGLPRGEQQDLVVN